MLAVVSSHAPVGMDGTVVSVEVDLRNGIPGIDLVGLPDSAVRESRERVRVAIRNSGFRFPTKRILVNLAPAGIRKAGASFDLPIALAILSADGQIPLKNGRRIMILGELNLSGRVRPVNGVLSAIDAGLRIGIATFLVPVENRMEAGALNRGRILSISSLKEAVLRLAGNATGVSQEAQHQSGAQIRGKTPYVREEGEEVSPDFESNEDYDESPEKIYGDLADLRGHRFLKRALEIATAGRHNLFLFGPPGSGKTMAAKRLASLMPPLDREEALTVTRIHSIAGFLPRNSGLIRNRPFRMPHHTASGEGLIGGGKWLRPGEVSLAHAGILFLDEAHEFRQNLLQNLREPSEDGMITIVRAASSIRYPASFQLVMASNSCPCGNLGHDDRVCICSVQEIERYWKRLGNALLDRMDIRVPVKPVSVPEMMGDQGETSYQVRQRIRMAVKRQRRRFRGLPFSWNSKIPPGRIVPFCKLSSDCTKVMTESVASFSLSSRACHSILKIARTIADLNESADICKEHILEAVQLRRFSGADRFWSYG